MISKSNFVGEHIADIRKYYNVIRDLGRGTYGHVIRVQNISTGGIFACKKMNKRQIKNKERFKLEIELLRATDHPNIIKLYDIYEDNIFLYLIMEECLGGEFFDRLAKKAEKNDTYTEKDAARIFKQILEAVNYLHTHGVCHRDLKPENILFSTIEEKSPIKLIDFGLSKVFNSDNHSMKGEVGTKFYIAPEVIQGNYNEKCDVWSCGVILYMMLSGRAPFYSEDEDELKKIICSMKYNFDYPEFTRVSKEAKDLITLIFVDKNSRPSVSDLLQHKWIKDNAPHSNEEALDIDWFHIRKYSQLNLMQKSVINFTAFKLNDEQRKHFVDIFKSLDENSDGVLSMEEIKKGVQLCKFGPNFKADEVIEIFNEMDVDKNGLINFTEFISALMDFDKYIKREQLLECFKGYDLDGSGKISFEEFCNMIKPQNEEEKKNLFILFKKFDKNNDGEMDFEEFVNGFNMNR